MNEGGARDVMERQARSMHRSLRRAPAFRLAEQALNDADLLQAALRTGPADPAQWPVRASFTQWLGYYQLLFGGMVLKGLPTLLPREVTDDALEVIKEEPVYGYSIAEGLRFLGFLEAALTDPSTARRVGSAERTDGGFSTLASLFQAYGLDGDLAALRELLRDGGGCGQGQGPNDLLDLAARPGAARDALLGNGGTGEPIDRALRGAVKLVQLLRAIETASTESVYMSYALRGVFFSSIGIVLQSATVLEETLAVIADGIRSDCLENPELPHALRWDVQHFDAGQAVRVELRKLFARFRKPSSDPPGLQGLQRPPHSHPGSGTAKRVPAGTVSTQRELALARGSMELEG